MPAPVPTPAVRCRGCAYDLRDLPAGRCPECGRDFDPARPRTIATRPLSGRRVLARSILAAILVTAPLGLAWLTDLGLVDLGNNEILTLIVASLLPGGLVIGVVLAGRVCAADSGLFARHPWVEHRAARAIGVTISALILAALAVIVVANA